MVNETNLYFIAKGDELNQVKKGLAHIYGMENLICEIHKTEINNIFIISIRLKNINSNRSVRNLNVIPASANMVDVLLGRSDGQRDQVELKTLLKNISVRENFEYLKDLLHEFPEFKLVTGRRNLNDKKN